MAGVSFSELLLLFVIGLLILGPERLPRVASQIGRWVGRARRTANQLRYQLEREIALSDIEANKKKQPPPAKPAPAPDAASTASRATAGKPAPEASATETTGSSAARAPAGQTAESSPGSDAPPAATRQRTADVAGDHSAADPAAAPAATPDRTEQT